MGLPDELAFPTPPEGADEPTRLAVEAWGQIARLFLSQQKRREEVAAEAGLHVGDLISLFHLIPDVGVSQRSLADQWACDPSWVTNRVDQLEASGLAERRVSPTDRRVKEVWLTSEGQARRRAGMAGFGRPPEALAGLSTADLRALTKIMAKLDPGESEREQTS